MPETYEKMVDRVLRDHEGYTGDGAGGVGALPVGDRSSAAKPISKRDMRALLKAPVSFAMRAEKGAEDAEAVVGGLGTLQSAVNQAAAAEAAAEAARLAAEAAEARAGMARDAAFIHADVYPDTAAGLAATENGQQFIVVEGNQAVRYRRVVAGTATVVARYPTADAVLGTPSSDFNAISVNGIYYGTNANGAPVSDLQVVVQHYETTRSYQVAFAQWPGTAGTKERHFFRFRTATEWRPWREIPATDDLGALAFATNVPPSAQTPGDRSSIFPDPASVEASLYTGSLVTVSTPTVGALPAVRKSSSVITLTGTTAAQEVFGPAFPVEAGASYVMSGVGGRNTGVGSVTTRFMANWYSDHAATVLISSERIGADHTGTAPSKRRAKLTAPANAVACKISFQKGETASSVVTVFFDVDVIRAVDDLALASEKYVEPTIAAVAGLITHISPSPLFPNTALYSKAPDRQIAPASLTKVVSAVTAVQALTEIGANISTFLITVNTADEVGGSGANVSNGDTLSFSDALTDMMLPSSNNAAMAVARTVGNALAAHRTGSTLSGVEMFVAEMNAVAASLGMSRSLFKNPTGLAISGQVTTVSDVNALMIKAVSIPWITNVWGKASAELSITGPNARTEVVTHSIPMMSDADVVGGKSGTLTPNLFSASLIVNAPKGNRIVATVLQSTATGQRYVDLRAMIDAIVKGADWPVITPQLRS